MKTNNTMIAICVVACLIVAGTAVWLLKPQDKTEIIKATETTASAPTISQTSNNVTMEGDTQIITISAKGGYAPGMTIAKAGKPTIIKVNTDSTYDCTTALAIPSLNYRSRLPMSGSTSIDVPPQKAEAEIDGICSMGMYSFAVKFVD